MNELVARLRKGWDVCSQIDLEEAADALESLEKSRKTLENLLREMDDELSRSINANDHLKADLRECIQHADAMARLLVTSAHYHDCYALQEYREWRAKQ